MKNFETMSVWSKWTTPIRAMVVLGFLSAASAQATEVVATYRASHGPVEAVLELNRALLGKLTISYTGHLYSCGCSNYSCEGNPIEAVFVTRRSGYPNSQTKMMQAFCRQPYHPGERGRNVAEAGVGQTWSTSALYWDYLDIQIWRETFGDLGRYYQGAEAPDQLPEIQIAFHANGRWDSRHGENYRLNFVKVSGP
jgi:hypothetical protein